LVQADAEELTRLARRFRRAAGPREKPVHQAIVEAPQTTYDEIRRLGEDDDVAVIVDIRDLLDSKRWFDHVLVPLGPAAVRRVPDLREDRSDDVRPEAPVRARQGLVNLIANIVATLGVVRGSEDGRGVDSEERPFREWHAYCRHQIRATHTEVAGLRS